MWRANFGVYLGLSFKFISIFWTCNITINSTFIQFNCYYDTIIFLLFVYDCDTIMVFKFVSESFSIMIFNPNAEDLKGFGSTILLHKADVGNFNLK